MESRRTAAAALVHYARLRPRTSVRHPRGTVRGTTRRIIPVQWEPSVRLPAPSVQLERTMHEAVFLVNGRSALRIRSPAPRSDKVKALIQPDPWNGLACAGLS